MGACLSNDEWTGCYADSWKGLIVEDAFSHPAKFSRALIRRIYQHAKDEGWIGQGDIVLDPFGGVSLGALDALLMGCTHISVELEEKFHLLAQRNVALWTRKFGRLSYFGSAILLQGDSRRLTSCKLEQVEIVIPSPPFLHQEKGGGLAKPDAVYSGDGHHFGANHGYQHQGETEGQLANLPEGSFDLCCSSPPYEGDRLHAGGIDQRAFAEPWRAGSNNQATTMKEYGRTEGQIGNMTNPTFWEASRRIIEQCHLLLKPEGYAIWVTKRLVRDKRIVDFTAQWAALFEAVGYRLLHNHKAMLAQEWKEDTLFDGEVKKEKRRESFFRRLHRGKYPHLAIDYEDVLCMRKGEMRK